MTFGSVIVVLGFVVGVVAFIVVYCVDAVNGTWGVVVVVVLVTGVLEMAFCSVIVLGFVFGAVVCIVVD